MGSGPRLTQVKKSFPASHRSGSREFRGNDSHLSVPYSISAKLYEETKKLHQETATKVYTGSGAFRGGDGLPRGSEYSEALRPHQ